MSDSQRYQDQDKFSRGNWTFNRKIMTIEFKNGYEIDVDDMTSSAKVLDWIIQIAEKIWATPTDVGDLVLLIDDLLHPQTTLCSMGQECGPIDPKTILKSPRFWS